MAAPLLRAEIRDYLRAVHSTATLDSKPVVASDAVKATLFKPCGGSVAEVASLARIMRYLVFMVPGLSSDAPLALTNATTVRRDWAVMQKSGGLNKPAVPLVALPAFIESLAALFSNALPVGIGTLAPAAASTSTAAASVTAATGGTAARANATGAVLLDALLAHYDATIAVAEARTMANRLLFVQVQGFLSSSMAADVFDGSDVVFGYRLHVLSQTASVDLAESYGVPSIALVGPRASI